jgi:HPt (histidine-containing phosphotransfer) domain-containing protein
MHADTADRFDAGAIERLRRFGGDALLFQMIDLFTASALARVEIARTAIADGDADAARRALHALKSSAGQMGAALVQHLCEQGEQRAAQGDTASVSAMLPALQVEAEAAVAWIAGIRRGERA